MGHRAGNASQCREGQTNTGAGYYRGWGHQSTDSGNVGPHFFAPLYDVWKTAVRAECPDMPIVPPWERTNDQAVVHQVLADGGVPNAKVTVEHNRLTLASPEEWWGIVIGTGLRRYVDEMGLEVAARVREHNLAWAQANRVTSVTLSAIYAVATKGH